VITLKHKNPLILLSSLLFYSPAQAVFVVDNKDLEIEVDYSKVCQQTTARFPAACLIEISSTQKFTGTLISSSVVLTCRHGVESEGKLVNPEKLIIHCNPDGKKSSYQVSKIHTFERSIKNMITQKSRTLDTGEDIVLLTLTHPVTEVMPALFRSVKEKEDIGTITLMGFGKGGLLSKTSCEKDALKAYELEGDPFFRFISGIKGNISIAEKLHCKEGLFYHNLWLFMYTRQATLGPGDSGGAILDSDGVIIGINDSRKKGAFLNLCESENGKIIEEFLSQGAVYVEKMEELNKKMEEYNKKMGKYNKRNVGWGWMKNLFLKKPELPSQNVPEPPSKVDIFNKHRKKLTDLVFDAFKDPTGEFSNYGFALDDQITVWMTKVIEKSQKEVSLPSSHPKSEQN
jgi:hypothetical protein